MKGKPQRVDLMVLRTQSGTEEWNKFLSKCLHKNDLASLERVLYGIQLGMDHLVKQKLNTHNMNVWFLKLQKSLEDTMKRVMKNRRPHILDNPLNAKEFGQHVGSKRERDQDIEKHLRKVRF